MLSWETILLRKQGSGLMRVVITTEDIYAKLMQVLVFLVKTLSNILVFQGIACVCGFQHHFTSNKDTSRNCFSGRNTRVICVRGPVRVTTLSWPFPVTAVLLPSWAGIYICIFVFGTILDIIFVPWFCLSFSEHIGFQNMFWKILACTCNVNCLECDCNSPALNLS